MIFGDPFKFSIQFDVVSKWNTGKWYNGVLNIFVDSKLIGNGQIQVSEIKTQISEMKRLLDVIKYSEKYFPEANGKFLNTDLYNWLLNLEFPKEISIFEEEYNSCLISPTALVDQNFCIFCVKISNFYKILAGNFNGELIAFVECSAEELEGIIYAAYNSLFQ
jgi:hypothetical protein